MPDHPAGLYIHLPWCVRKCPYCDFNSHALRTDLPEDDYVRALQADIRYAAENWRDREFTSVFFGGGTPSLFSGRSIDRILDTAHGELRIAGDVEISLEANPGTADNRHFQDYFKAGINRISLGFQSLDDHHLQQLGRIHSADESLRAYDRARHAGFGNINIDLMFGLPGQTQDSMQSDLDAVLALQPEHVSWYQLTIEPNTGFHLRPPVLPDHDLLAQMQVTGVERMADKGWTRYEISAFSRDGYQCRHNLAYWRFQDYLGVGAGAHGKSGRLRQARQRHPARYMQWAGSEKALQETRNLTDSDLVFEFLLNRLRLVEGFTGGDFEQCTGLGAGSLVHALRPAVNDGLVSRRGQRYQTTGFGYQFVDNILVSLMPDDAAAADSPVTAV